MPNYVRDALATRPCDEPALLTLPDRRQWSFGELVALSGSYAAAFTARGVTRGSVVLTLLGNGIDYAASMLACLRIGAAMLPCSEQLRAGDIALRMRTARPALIVRDRRNADVVQDALALAAPDCPVLDVPDPRLLAPVADPPPYAELQDADPAFVLFTSGTSGPPKQVTHGQRYVWGQVLQARYWLGAEPGELVWSTAAPGWSKSTRNAFLAAWHCGARALLQDARFDPAMRLATIRAEGVNVLCMAPTEYRLICSYARIGPLPSLRRAVTAGEPLGAAAYLSWLEQTGLAISDGYGQTETGQLTGVPDGQQAPPGSMGRPLPGVDLQIVDGELTLDPATDPTFFLGYGTPPQAPLTAGRWRTGDRVRQDEAGWLYFEHRADDVILSAGYRIGPTEVESVLQGHPAVRDVAVIGTPDADRGEVVTAVVVLRDGYAASAELAGQLQEHVKAQTAPYKYPRVVRFVAELPKTTSGKIARAQLRAG